MNPATKLWYFQYKHPRFKKIAGIISRLLFACEASCKQMGDGNLLEHNGLGVVISSMAVLGSNCKIYQGVTLGSGRGGYPVIGNNVTIYTNSTICGGVHIGDNAVIGANSFVNTDVPANTVYAGVPAKKINTISKK